MNKEKEKKEDEKDEHEEPVENLQSLSWKSKIYLAQQCIQIILLIAKDGRQYILLKKQQPKNQTIIKNKVSWSP